MRVKFVVQSALVGGLALLLGLGQGRTQNPGARPTNRERSRPPAPRAGAPTSWIDERFRRLDRNGDGVLTVDEMTEDLKLEKDKWDVNADSMIDLAEWRAYVTAVVAYQRRAAANRGTGSRDTARKAGQRPAHAPRVQNPPRRRLARRRSRPPFNEGRLAGPRGQGNGVPRLPSNLPAWFKGYDTDGDGQVSLYEWREREDNDREFSRYDLNGDGFITIEELIRSGQFAAGTNVALTPNLNGPRVGIGEFFYFEVTGTIGGNVWGTDVYTSDSPISTAAVHAGVLRPGERGLVKVTVLPGQGRYRGSFRNGVRTSDYGVFPRSYRVDEVPR